MDVKILLVIFFILQIVQSFQSYDYCQAPALSDSVDTEGLKLQQVQVLFRHGDRTPIQVLPNDDVVWNCTLNFLLNPGENFPLEIDSPARLHRKVYLPNREELPGDCAIGQLTEIGRQQHLKLGGEFRELYVNRYHLLPEHYDHDLIWVRSTDIPRTFQSLMANLEGLYPAKYQVNQKVAVIPIHTMDIKKEDMLANSNLCPNLPKEESKAEDTTAWKEHQAKLDSLRPKLAAIFNVTEKELPKSTSSILDPLEARKCHNKPIPKGLTKEIYDLLVNLTTWEANYMWKNPLIGQMGMSPFLVELFTRMESAVSGESKPKYLAYSAHDTTIGPLMAYLGTFNDLWPPYASHAEFELWSNSQSHWFVQVKYNGEAMKVGKCPGKMCPWETFRDHVKSILPSDYNSLCGL